jgi:phosphatidylethanolamine-binding protein (PEBP) family uncharacterized protein
MFSFAVKFVMTPTAFEESGVIPAKFVGQIGVSPELKWTQIPPNTQSIGLLIHDPEPSVNRSFLGKAVPVGWFHR